MTRLTDAQRDLAASCRKLAFSVAGPYAKRAPRLAADFYSDALLALVDAASRFDPARGVTFATFAKRRVNGAMLDRLRSETRYRRTTAPLNFGPMEFEPPDRAHPSDDPDFEDWFAHAFRGTAPRAREVLLRCELGGETRSEAGGAMGLSSSSVQRLAVDALAHARLRLEREAEALS